MMRKPSFPSNRMGIYVFASVLDVLDSFFVFVLRKLPKKRDFFDIFCKKLIFFKFFFAKSVKMADARKGINKRTFNLIFFATLSFLLLIFRCFSIFRFFDFFRFVWKIALKYVHFRGLDNFLTFFTFVFKWKEICLSEWKMTSRQRKRNLCRFCYVWKKKSEKKN